MDAGKRFAHLETDARKKLFAEHLINYVPVMGLIRRVLDERLSHTAPEARFRNELEDQADETLKTVDVVRFHLQAARKNRQIGATIVRRPCQGLD
jgi:hypothetical protein